MKLVKNNNMFLSVVVAIYNEEENVSELTERLYQSLSKLDLKYEIIYVVDGTDNSFKILSDIKKSKKNLILNYSKELRGFRKAFVAGFNLVNKQATHILTLDGDLNHQPEEIGRFIDKMLKTRSDMIIGSRYVKSGKIGNIALWKKGISVFANIMIKLIWHLDIADKTSGFRLYKRKVIDRVVPLCTSNNFEFLFEILIISRKLGYKISEVPINFKPRKHGESKFKVWKTSKGYLKLMFKRH